MKRVTRVKNTLLIMGILVLVGIREVKRKLGLTWTDKNGERKQG